MEKINTKRQSKKIKKATTSVEAQGAFIEKVNRLLEKFPDYSNSKEKLPLPTFEISDRRA